MSHVTTQQKILRAAQSEFAAHGFAGARVDRIAALAGANKAMIYYHFRSKENLYQEIINDHVTRIAAFVEKNVTRDTDSEVLFRKAAEFMYSLFRDREQFIPIMLHEMADGGVRMQKAMKQLVSDKGYTANMIRRIDDGKKKGAYRKVDSRQAMISFLGMNLFYLMMSTMANSLWGIHDEEQFKRERPEQIVDLFLYGLKARQR